MLSSNSQLSRSMLSRFRKRISGDVQERRLSDRNQLVNAQHSDNLQIPSDSTSDALMEVQQMLAFHPRVDEEVVLETTCTFANKTRYLVASKYSIRLYKSKKHWLSLKKRDSPQLSLLIHDCYAMLPEVPAKKTLHIRTTDAIVPIKMHDEDAVDQCIALINTQASSSVSQQARLHFWKGKYTVHMYLTEGWDLPLLDSGSTNDPYIRIRLLPKDPGKTRRRKPGEIDHIMYTTRIRDRERNPVFSDQFTFLSANSTDQLLIEIFDYDQWMKKELIGCIPIDLSLYLDHGVHGWFPILDNRETARPGRGYLHIKVAILDATESIDCMSMNGAHFNSLRQSQLQQLSNFEPISPISQRITVFVGSWNVGNEPPPNDLSLWVARHSDALANVKSFPIKKLFREPIKNARHKRSESSVDLSFPEMPTSLRRHKRTESNESLESMDNYEFDSRIDLGSLNDLKIRSQRPRMGVKSGRYVSRSTYDRSPIEVVSPPGLYVIASQECHYTPKGGSSSNCKDDWIQLLSDHLGQEYVQVEYSSLWQIRLAIFARKEIAQHISNINVHKEATGIGHVLGNKGAVVISFRLYHALVCFVDCHLAAHQTKHEQRNQDIRDIITKSSCKIGNKQSDLANQFHYIWFIGDLNYRLDYGAQTNAKSPSIQEFREMECLIQAGRFNILFNFDQLTRDMQRKEIMTGWSEGIYDFPPTFKVDRNAGFKYNPTRSPAWCDRILWKSFLSGYGQSNEPIEQTSMKVCESIATSDHKPISSLFNIDVFFFQESRDVSRGRAELLFTEVSLELSDSVTPANSAQYHLRFRSDCFSQNPITQALVERPVRFFSPTNAMILAGSPAEVPALSQDIDENWLSAPLHPIIKLKHNNLQRLRQHIISVELLHCSGVMSGQGHMTFHMFRPPITNPKPTPTKRSRLFETPISIQVDSPEACSRTQAPYSSVSMHSTPRKNSEMVIRPSSARESARRSSRVESLARKSVSQMILNQRVDENRPLSIEVGGSPTYRNNSMPIEQFATLQSNVPFSCELSIGTSYIGTLSGAVRLSWAINTP